MAQRVWLQDADVATPTEEPLRDLTQVADGEGHEQAVGPVVHGEGEVGGRLAHPARNLWREERAHSNVRRFLLALMRVEADGGGTLEGFRKGSHAFDAFEAEGAQATASVAVAGEIPGCADVGEAVGIDSACSGIRWRGSVGASGVAGVVVEADAAGLDDGSAQQLELFELLRRVRTRGGGAGDELDALAQRRDGLALGVWEDAEDLAAGGAGDGLVVGVEALGHDVDAEEENGGFVGAEADGWKKVAFDEGVAAAGDGDDGDTGLAEGEHVAVDGALAGLEGLGEVFGAAPASALELEDNSEKTIGAVHGIRNLHS